MKKIKLLFVILIVGMLLPPMLRGSERDRISEAASRLEERAASLADEMFGHFRGWNNEISDREQIALFKSAAFAASCHLFAKLAGGANEYFAGDYVRTNLYNAFMLLNRSFGEFEDIMRQTGLGTSVLGDCRRRLEEIDRQFSSWPATDNLSFLDGKYVQSHSRKLYLIEKRGRGAYIRRAFTDLESLWRFNFQMKREKDPWKHLVEVPRDTLEKMEEGEPIHLTFEGCLVMSLEKSNNRPVYLIQGGRKRVLASPQVLERYGGWKNVFEIPGEIITGYEEGESLR